MLLKVGPLPSSSAQAWIDYARLTIEDVNSDPFETPVADDVVAAFEDYLDQWAAAASSPVFCWETDVPGELAEYLVHAFHQLVSRLAEAAELRGEPLQPPEGEVFYRALVNAIIDGLMMESDSAAEYGMHLRSFWPGLADVADDSSSEVV